VTDTLVRQMVEAAASRCEWVNFPYPKDVLSPLSVLLATLSPKIAAPLDFALVACGFPDFFTLKVGDRFIVAIDVNYLGAVHGMLVAFLSALPIRDRNLRRQARLELCVQLIQNYIPPASFDDPIRPRMNQNLARFSEQTGRVSIVFQSAPMELEMLPYDEFYLALWFFFACHEACHCMRETGDWRQLIPDDLEDLAVFDLPHARQHVDRLRAVIPVDSREALFTLDDPVSLIEEIFCDQGAFLLVLELAQVMREKRFGEFSGVSYLVDSIFNIFAAHQALLELRRLRQRIGLLSERGLAGYRADRLRNAIRFSFLEDFVACLVPGLESVAHFKSTPGFSTFGYGGAFGIREMAWNAQAAKRTALDDTMEEALQIVFAGCL